MFEYILSIIICIAHMCIIQQIWHCWAYGLVLAWVAKHNIVWPNSWSLNWFPRQMHLVYVYHGYTCKITKIWYYITPTVLYIFKLPHRREKCVNLAHCCTYQFKIMWAEYFLITWVICMMYVYTLSAQISAWDIHWISKNLQYIVWIFYDQ